MAWITVLLWTPLAHTLMVLEFRLPGYGIQIPAELPDRPGRLDSWSGKDSGARNCPPLCSASWEAASSGWAGWKVRWSISAIGSTRSRLMYMGVELFTANLLLLQATGVFLIALLIWLASNKDTHCRMFMWFHRNLKLTPARRTDRLQAPVLPHRGAGSVHAELVLLCADPSRCSTRGFWGLRHPATIGTVIAVFIVGNVAPALPHADHAAAGGRASIRGAVRQHLLVLRRSGLSVAAVQGTLDQTLRVSHDQRVDRPGVRSGTGLVH